MLVRARNFERFGLPGKSTNIIRLQMMSSFSSSVKVLREKIPNIIAIYLYGSHAQGRARSDSDVDLAVLVAAPVARELLDTALSDLLLIHEAVDLVDLRDVPLTLAIQAIDEGRCLYCSSEAKRAEWETTLMSRYANLNEERREILQDIKARGKIYE